jgi:hypothetical protein
MYNWPKQTPSQLNNFYGNPDLNGDGAADLAWAHKNLTSITPPYQMFYGDRPIKAITVHRLCAEALEEALAGIREHYGSQAEIVRVGMQRFGGVYNFRVKRGGSGLSLHAYAAAIDLDPEHNPFRSKGGTMPGEVVKIFESVGAEWGGMWSPKSRDPMHFQFARTG